MVRYLPSVQNVFSGSVLDALLIDLGAKLFDLVGLEYNLGLKGVAFTLLTEFKIVLNAFPDAIRLDLGGLDLSPKRLDLFAAGAKRLIVLDTRPSQLIVEMFHQRSLPMLFAHDILEDFLGD